VAEQKIAHASTPSLDEWPPEAWRLAVHAKRIIDAGIYHLIPFVIITRIE